MAKLAVFLALQKNDGLVDYQVNSDVDRGTDHILGKLS